MISLDVYNNECIGTNTVSNRFRNNVYVQERRCYRSKSYWGARCNCESFSVFYKETTIVFSLQQLVSNGAKDVVVTCPGSSSKLPSGVKVATVDLTDVNALTKAFKENNIEVVVSTVSMAALPGEHLPVDAAEAAGVQLFIMSEFGHFWCQSEGRGISATNWVGNARYVVTNQFFRRMVYLSLTSPRWLKSTRGSSKSSERATKNIIYPYRGYCRFHSLRHHSSPTITALQQNLSHRGRERYHA